MNQHKRKSNKDKHFIQNLFNVHYIGKSKVISIFGFPIKFKLKKINKQTVLNNLEYHLAEHCNLNCKNCDHFSPIAEPCLAKIEDFERDIKRFAQLSGQKLNELKLLGGEPLLNPDIINFMRVAREQLPNTDIQIVTNGILLNQQNKEFWNACKRYNIKIEVTKYPLNIDYNKMQQTAKKHGVMFEFFGKIYNIVNIIKTSYHIPLDTDGKQNPTENFINCFHANNCVMLKNGRIYPCTVAPNIEHFNKYFGYELSLEDRDGIDIHKAISIDEILAFIARPIPFCKYCNVKCRTYGHKWGFSKKEIEEWTLSKY